MSRCSRSDNGIFWHSLDANPRLGRRISWFFWVPNKRVMHTCVSRKGSVCRVCVDVRLSSNCARKDRFLVILRNRLEATLEQLPRWGPRLA
jgi:hypothetical protein